MEASNNCINLIKACEGFRSEPYLCPAGIPTIGYGSTRYADNSLVKLTDPPISEVAAESLLLLKLGEFERAVNRYVQVPLNQNQFDALVDFAYNAGAQNLRTSTLLKLLNAKEYEEAADEFGKWVYGNGKKLNGLVRRRFLEAELFRRKP
jgi:lysozyme